jgi:hypothetical protein
MIIEFIAPPGAGKSFFSSRLGEYLRNSYDWSDYKILMSNDLLTHKSIGQSWLLRKLGAIVFYFSAISPTTIKLMIQVFQKHGTGKNGRDLSLYVLGIFARYVKARRLCAKSKCVVILDEGVFQIARLFFNDDKLIEQFPKYVEQLRRSKILPDRESTLTIFIISNVEENFNRIEKRASGWPRIFKNLSIQERKVLLSKFHDEISMTVPLLSKESFVFEIDNAMAINYNEKTLQEQLRNISKAMSDLSE